MPITDKKETTTTSVAEIIKIFKGYLYMCTCIPYVCLSCMQTTKIMAIIIKMVITRILALPIGLPFFCKKHVECVTFVKGTTKVTWDLVRFVT